MDWQTIGHEKIKRLLAKQLAASSLPQGYVWLGPEGVGKRTLALELAEQFAPEPGSMMEYSFENSDVETVRSWVSQLSLKPVSGRSQVAIFDAAENITTTAANVLLKPLEEPTAGTYMIFIASRRSLPATVLSRCQELHFGRLSSSDLQQILPASPQDELASQHVEWKSDFSAVTSGTVFERLAYVSRLATEESELLRKRFEFWLTLAARSPRPTTLTALLEGWKRLGMHANKKLVLEYVCLNV